MLILTSADFFQNEFLQKVISGIQSECKTVWIQIRVDIVSFDLILGPIWLQRLSADHKSYPQQGKG